MRIDGTFCSFFLSAVALLADRSFSGGWAEADGVAFPADSFGDSSFFFGSGFVFGFFILLGVFFFSLSALVPPPTAPLGFGGTGERPEADGADFFTGVIVR